MDGSLYLFISPVYRKIVQKNVKMFLLTTERIRIRILLLTMRVVKPDIEMVCFTDFGLLVYRKGKCFNHIFV